MTDDQIRETLGRINPKFYSALAYKPLCSCDHCEIARALAERQAALEEIVKEIGTGILIASLEEYAKKLKRVGAIARRFTGGE